MSWNRSEIATLFNDHPKLDGQKLRRDYQGSFESISGHRVLLILTYRPEGVGNLAGKSYVN